MLRIIDHIVQRFFAAFREFKLVVKHDELLQGIGGYGVVFGGAVDVILTALLGHIEPKRERNGCGGNHRNGYSKVAFYLTIGDTVYFIARKDFYIA